MTSEGFSERGLCREEEEAAADEAARGRAASRALQRYSAGEGHSAADPRAWQV